MNQQKVAIIGAGITGLYLAWKLSERGYKVTVFERKSVIGKEACSGLFSEKILNFIPESKELIQHKISSVLIHFPRKTVKTVFSRKFFLMNHAELDRLVAGLAEKAGAEIRTGSPIESLPKGFDRIIGCDGANSFVRKILKGKEPKQRLGIIGFISKEDSSDYVETWAVKNGFIWRIPRVEKTEYGIIAGMKNAGKLFEIFLKKKNIDLPKEKMISALIPHGLSIPKSDSAFLCGDAAGLTKPWSGGGVIWGLKAADILLKNYPNTAVYRRELKKYFGLRMFILGNLTKIIYCLGFGLPWLLPKNMKIDGDFLINKIK